MWKLILGFLIFAALGIWLLTRGGGDIDLSGEKHDTASTHSAEKDAKVQPKAATPAAAVPAPAPPAPASPKP